MTKEVDETKSIRIMVYCTFYNTKCILQKICIDMQKICIDMRKHNTLIDNLCTIMMCPDS